MLTEKIELRYRANLGDRETAEWFARRSDFAGNGVEVELLGEGWVDFGADCLALMWRYTTDDDCSVTLDGSDPGVVMSMWIGGDSHPIYKIPPGEPVVWSAIQGQSPHSRVVEPGLAGVEIPFDVLAWAESCGLSDDDPDVYLAVTPADEAGEVAGEIAFIRRPATVEEVRLIREALDKTWA